MCRILNVLILCAFSMEIWEVCDLIDEAEDRKAKAYCYIRLIISAIIIYIAIMTLYKVYGINDDNLIDYLKGL